MVNVRFCPEPPGTMLAFGINAGLEDVALSCRFAAGVSASDTVTGMAVGTSSFIVCKLTGLITGDAFTRLAMFTVLFAGVLSNVLAVTRTWFVIGPGLLAVQAMLIVAVALRLIEPTVKVITLPLMFHMPWLVLIVPIVSDEGTVLVTITPAAAAGPRFDTVMLKIS